MVLKINSYNINNAEFTDGASKIEGDTIFINQEALKQDLSHESLVKVELDIVKPGDSVRIIKVLDMVQPIASPDKKIFPGFLNEPSTVGWGSTNRIEGFRIISCGTFPQIQTTSLTTKDGIIDMSGPGAEICMGSDTVNFVVTYYPKDNVSNEEFDNITRKLTLTLAEYFGKMTLDLEPDKVDNYDLSIENPELPNVVYANQLQDQGPHIRPYLYGRPLGENFVPTWISPLEMMDGAIVSGNYRNCMKKPTSFHLSDPIVAELMQQHNKSLNFKGVIVYRGHHGDSSLKLRSSSCVAKLAKMIGADGVVVAMEGTGNGTIDFQFTIESCEKANIKTVGIIHELGGTIGDDAPLVYRSPYTDALVSTGGVEREFPIGPVEKVIGGNHYLNYMMLERDPQKGFIARPMDFYGSFWKMNASGITCQEI
ncbi:MAG: glycine/sarcosine/betaine reductase component B subunit [Dehalobacterium sp.]